jgi:hypothetical protein
MTEEYKTLINRLLYCNEGEEWEVLQQYPWLLTPDLLVEMERVADELKRNKKQKEADWLLDFAKLFKQWLKVMHFL